MSKLSQFRPKPGAVLVVDDEPDVLDSLQALLEASIEGVTVYTASDAAAALEVLDKEDLGLILSDYRMPGMDGLEFLIEARRRAPRIPRILLTAYPDQDLARRAVEHAQIETFLTKPSSPDRLIEAVNAALAKFRQNIAREDAFKNKLGHHAQA